MPVPAAAALAPICGISVLEVDEVLQHPTLVRRRSLCQVASGDRHAVPVFAAPLAMPMARPARIALLGDDSMEWMHQ
jgi:crotonobetainyl-CoA:carnitine CoA-transferase CaiB-like acyl-CoA transferase